MRQENECFAEDWKLIPFSTNIEMLSGFPFDSKHFNDSEGKPLIRIRNIISGTTETYYNGEYSDEYLIAKGNILVGMDRDFHIKKWQGSESLLNQRILKLYENVESKINIDFFYYLSQPFLLKVHKRTAGTTVKHLSTKDYKNASFKVPVYKEQQKIAEILSTVDAKIEVIDQQIKETEQLKKGMMQRLLTKGIGHIDFKNSKLGKIPKSWEVVKIGEIADITAGGTPSTKEAEYWGGDIPWMNSGEINLRRIKSVQGRITDLGLNNSSTKLIPKNSVLMALAGQGKTRGKVAVNEIPLCTNQSLATIYNFKKANFEYIFQNLESRYSEIRRMSTGDGGRGGLNLTIIKSIPIALPSINEQNKISSVLILFDEKIENLISKKFKYEDLKKGLMQKLLTGKIRVKID